MKRLIPLLLSATLLATACGDDAQTDAGGGGNNGAPTSTTTAPPVDIDTPEGRLASARALWATNGLTSYQLSTAEICFCPENLWLNTVVDGEVVTHTSIGQEFFDPGPRTMETLFDEIDDAIMTGFATLDVEYHPETGAVIRFYVDVALNMADEEHGVEVTNLGPYDPTTEAPQIEAVALTDDYGCGYGFEKGSIDQTLRLSLDWTAGFEPEASPPNGPIALPDDGWTARLITGTDLYSNYCDDVIEEHEPEPVHAVEWLVVSGTLSLTSDVPASGEGGSVTATLTDAVVESPIGEQVALDDITLENSCWGCFAG